MDLNPIALTPIHRIMDILISWSE